VTVAAPGILIGERARRTGIGRALADLKAARDELAAIRASWRRLPPHGAVVCPHIERMESAARKEVSRDLEAFRKRSCAQNGPAKPARRSNRRAVSRVSGPPVPGTPTTLEGEEGFT
jgi:hypothetical protein